MPGCRLSTGYGKTLPEPHRVATRHPGHADPANPPLGPAARLRDRGSDPCRIARGSASGDGIALPRSASDGEARVGEIGMEADGKQPAGEVLQPHSRGTEASCG